MNRVIFHIDVNSAYLSWEAVYRLQRGGTEDLRNIPSVIGGDVKKRHGIVLAKSIPAKAYHIQTGESLMEARKKCPHLKIVPPNYGLYMKCSQAMVDLIGEYASTIQRYSVDECFIDFTDAIALKGDPLKVAHQLKDRIKKELGFTVSVGISSNKLLAKMASELKKPDAVSTLFPEEISYKMWPLPVGELFMVGRATYPKLKQIGIETIGDLAQLSPDILTAKLKSHGHLIWQYANGIENSPVKKSNRLEIKSIGNSTTISFDVDTEKEALLVLLSLCEMVGMRLREHAFLCQLVSVHFKNANFESISKQKKLAMPIEDTEAIYQAAKMLFLEVWDQSPIRQLGISVSEFCGDDFLQRSFFDASRREKMEKLDHAIDALRLKYHMKAVVRGAFLNSGISPMTGGVGEEGSDYPMMGSLL